MNIKESIEIVTLLHAAYPQDKRTTQEELFQRAEAYSIALAEYDVQTVRKAAERCIASLKFYPTTKELLDAVSFVRLTTPAEVTPITRAEPIDDEKLEAYLDAFCEWIGFGSEPNDNADIPLGVLNYEK